MFLHLPSPGTVANLAHNPNVEVNVVDPIRRKGHRFAGRCYFLIAGEEYERIQPELGSRRRQSSQ